MSYRAFFMLMAAVAFVSVHGTLLYVYGMFGLGWSIGMVISSWHDE